MEGLDVVSVVVELVASEVGKDFQDALGGRGGAAAQLGVERPGCAAAAGRRLART